MMILEFLKSMYRAFIAKFNSAPTPTDSTPNGNSATNGNSRLPGQESPTQLLLSYYKSTRQRWPPIVPPSWSQAGLSPVLGRVVFTFGQNIDELRNGTPPDQLTGWTAQLDLVTRDIHSMMRDGLFLTCENVRQEENHVKQTYTEGIGNLHNRCYTVTSSKWSGYLNVCAGAVKPVASFRLHHLSAENVFTVSVGNHKSYQIYRYDARRPENNANYLYDDMPMEGLWPWPRKEEGLKEEEVLKREGGDGDQGKETERKETKEGEEVVKDEEEGEEEEETGLEEEELDGFSAWEEEDPFLKSWRD
ncbi:hypothetical protein LCI18_012981 [Fusarium solani-melongenae]|uniref:Uncharacterized protein n=1 Tax=Fusarium solani subsp. cucurbitae TaxID=2747967 RepID=A0ACD3ZLR7_FUSSC|nr:hypothetical protein LCI18_012981 [Fusarium solani-melongenae]